MNEHTPHRLTRREFVERWGVAGAAVGLGAVSVAHGAEAVGTPRDGDGWKEKVL